MTARGKYQINMQQINKSKVVLKHRVLHAKQVEVRSGVQRQTKTLKKYSVENSQRLFIG